MVLWITATVSEEHAACIFRLEYEGDILIRPMLCYVRTEHTEGAIFVVCHENITVWVHTTVAQDRIHWFASLAINRRDLKFPPVKKKNSGFPV